VPLREELGHRRWSDEMAMRTAQDIEFRSSQPRHKEEEDSSSARHYHGIHNSYISPPQ